MKKRFEAPELETVFLDETDVICTSGFTCGTGANQTTQNPEP